MNKVKFKIWWCKWFHTHYKIDGKWTCGKCNLKFDWLPDIIFPG